MIQGSSESRHILYPAKDKEYGKKFSFIKHFTEFLGGLRDNSSFSRNAVNVHKLYFESPFSLLELLIRIMNLVRN